MKKILIISLILVIFTGCDDKSKKNEEYLIDISTSEYFELLNTIFTESTEGNEFLYYSGYAKHYPYIQVEIKPIKRINKSEMEEQAKIVENKILTELKKHNYKSGSIFRYNYEYINIYFYDYTINGQLSRNGGPFLQLEILNI